MITTGPFTISAGETQSLANPYSSSTQANRVQVQNASPLVLTLTTGAETVTVPADSAATASLSAQVPTVAATGSGAGQYRVSWLMASDPLPIPNGPLTSEQVVIGNVPAVTITGTPDVSVASGTIDVGTLPDVNLAAGSTVDANITNATLTVETSGTTDVNVTNATVPVSGSITASIDGPVAVSSGTIYIVNPFTGESLPSPTTSTTTGNATLSSTDYNLISWPAVPLPAGSAGNLVYDSNLTNAIASVGPTWVGRAGYVPTIGTADGDMNVLNAGTDSAEWVYYGDGAQTGTLAVISQGVAVTPGATYTLSARMDATNMTAGTMQVQLYNSSPAPAIAYLVLGQSLGGNGRISGQVTIPAGVTTVYPAYQLVNPSVTAGDTISWSQIQLTETSTVQPYEPGPLWTYPVYGRGGYLGETTALAFEDTGGAVDTSRQPPTINSTYPQLEAPTPTVTVEGTAGTTTYDYQVTVKTDNASAGATRLAPSPGTNIGTIDISPGATVEIAAGSAQIGTVDLASGASVDANITNATLDITGSTVDISGNVSTITDETNLTSMAVAANSSDSVTVTPPAGSRTMILVISGGSALDIVKVTGTTTGTVYTNGAKGNSGFVTCPISRAVDASYTVSYTTVTATAATVYVNVHAGLNYVQQTSQSQELTQLLTTSIGGEFATASAQLLAAPSSGQIYLVKAVLTNGNDAPEVLTVQAGTSSSAPIIAQYYLGPYDMIDTSFGTLGLGVGNGLWGYSSSNVQSYQFQYFVQ